ncbi:hypothetical protein G4B84_010754 [Aspergillus flavus NRRL3357]|nr:uncharacterized protein G4B84_010754 [Aspergillus flavus NRRL3357]QMW35263.1 hypothetical protein G4B84_010754 [Aspergillus flavus NRRL3357]QMW47325.1 hypothetical protein G4B11_010804 [Aspergillus flavus]
MPTNTITLIISPYHVGLRDHRVGNGPHRIQSQGLIPTLKQQGLQIRIHEIPSVDNFEGEIGRSFEILRRISVAVTEAVDNNTFPLILAGNCMSSAAVACGLKIHDLSFIYFDAHDDLDSPDVNENGYFDAMGLSMLRGESWKTLMGTVPNYKPFSYEDRFLYCGLRDQSDVQRQRVIEAGMKAVWGETARKVDFVGELRTQMEERSYGSALVHLDLDVLDESYGKVNDYPSPGGLTEEDLVACMDLVPRLSEPRSLTVCSFDPDVGDGDTIARIGIRAIRAFAVEVIKPGWVRENYKHGLVNVEREGADDDFDLVVPTMTLGIRPPKELRDPFSRELQHSFSFHLLRLSTSPVYRSFDFRAVRFVGQALSQSLEVSKDSGSSAAFNRARQWLSHCVQHDQACQPPDTEFMPRRLVNVGSWDGSREPFLFEPTTPVIYACLSYCWGIDIDRVMKTTTDNIHSHYQRLELAQLPAAIQDAIAVCRALKIPNLWVDSLCIIQDDKVAWLHDASTMHDVYHNSHLTIAVMEPNSCKLRFLGKQQFGDHSWQRLFCPTLPDLPEDTSTELLMRPGKFKPRSDTERSSLDKRGWCLQESLLPNRRLCYDGKEMIWECLCRQVCECGHVVEPQIPRNTSKDYGKLGTTLKTHLPEAEPPFDRMNGFRFRHCSPSMMPYFGWRDLATDYSHRSLSKRYDALRAISALAKMVQKRLPEKDGLSDEYVAGLWKGELHFDLSWEVKPVDAHDVPPSTGLEDDNETSYRIPSWSWASVGKPITYSFTDAFRIWKYEPEVIDRCQIKVIDCKREVPEDPTSAVIGGSLVLQGAFAPVKLVNENERKVAYVQSPGAQTLPISLDSPALVANGDDQYYCFKLFTLVGYNYDQFAMGPETRFLVLKRSTYKEGAFERIGTGVWDDNFGGKRPCPLFVDVEPVAVEMV